MFADAIKKLVHPATWAVLAIKHTPTGDLTGQATAFAVDTKGHLLTCHHTTFVDKDCQVPADEFVVLQPELHQAVYSATLIDRSADRDVALLAITGNVRTTAAQLYRGSVPSGRSCCAFGHPLAVADPATNAMRIFTRASAGIVSMPHQLPIHAGGPPVSVYELDFFTHAGSSGGPVLLRNGDVFAFVRASLMLDDGSGKHTRSNLSMAVSVNEAIEFLKPHNVHVQAHGGTSR